MTERSGPAAAWLRQQARMSRRTTAIGTLIGLCGTGAAVAQAWCIAAFIGGFGPNLAFWPAAFAFLALARANLQIAADRNAFHAGAVARRRVRTDLLARMRVP